MNSIYSSYTANGKSKKDQARFNVVELSAEDLAEVEDLSEINPDNPAQDPKLKFGKDYQRHILSAIYHEPTLLAEISSLVKAKSFVDETHQKFFRSLDKIYKSENRQPEQYEIFEDIYKSFREGTEHAVINRHIEEAQAIIEAKPAKATHPTIRRKLETFARYNAVKASMINFLDEWEKGEGAVDDFVAKLQAGNEIGRTPTASPWESSKELDEAEIEHSWLIEGMLVEGQPCILGGPSKSMKTTVLVDLVLSVATGTPFLGKWKTSQAKALFISGESGQWTIQETARRIAKNKSLKLSTVDAFWGYDLPKLSDERELAEFSRNVASAGIKLVIIDPLYLCLLDGQSDKKQGKSAANVYDMGPLLKNIAKACLSAGATPILAHHTKKNLNNPHQPLELEDLAYAGVQEFARQWLLLNRREPYRPGTGEHALWFTSGGSVGHGGLWGLSVDEGIQGTNFEGRKWSVDVLTLDEIRQKKEEAKIEKEQREEDDNEQIFLMHLVAYENDPPSRTQLMNELGWHKPKFGRIFERLIKTGEIHTQIGKSKNGKSCEQIHLGSEEKQGDE